MGKLNGLSDAIPVEDRSEVIAERFLLEVEREGRGNASPLVLQQIEGEIVQLRFEKTRRA